MSGASWQARTAVALLVGAGGEGGCALLARYVGGAFALATFAIAIALGLRFGPWIGATGAGTPPLGLLFVIDSEGSSTVGSRVLSVLAVVLMLGGPAWIAGRVRERYGHPPWGHSSRGSE